MTLYVDSSALLKRYVDEHDSEASVGLMATDPVLVTSASPWWAPDGRRRGRHGPGVR
jgi:hypothetical protein